MAIKKLLRRGKKKSYQSVGCSAGLRTCQKPWSKLHTVRKRAKCSFIHIQLHEKKIKASNNNSNMKRCQESNPHLHHAPDERAIRSTVPLRHGVKDPLCIIVLPVGHQMEEIYCSFSSVCNIYLNNEYAHRNEHQFTEVSKNIHHLPSHLHTIVSSSEALRSLPFLRFESSCSSPY